jgi:uncharacterized protein YggE
LRSAAADPDAAAFAKQMPRQIADEEKSMTRTMRVLLAAGLTVLGTLGSATAQTQTANPLAGERLISVIGEGTVRGRPDMALLTLGVVSEAKTAGEALAANNASAGRILAALRTEGIEARDLQTSGFSVEPVYSQPPRDFDGSQPFEPQIVGYRVRNEVVVRIRDLDRAGALLDQAVTLGANSISGPTFNVSDPTPLEDQARRAAMRDALRKGALYAEAASLALGPVFRIEETIAQFPQPVPLGAMAREMAADSAVPIERGELTFQARIAVSWQLRN